MKAMVQKRMIKPCAAMGVGVCLAGGVACAPLATIPPAMPMTGGDWHETGATLVGGAAVITEDQERFAGPLPPSLQLHGVWEVAPSLQVGMVGYLIFAPGVDFFDHIDLWDVPLVPGGGGFVRYYFVDEEKVRVGGELQLGWLWGAAAVPMSVQLRKDVWLYTSPSIGPRALNWYQLPLGLTFYNRKHNVINIETGVGVVHGGDGATGYLAIGWGTRY